MTIETQEFNHLLTDLKVALKAKDPGEARLAFDGVFFTIQVQGVVVKAKAEGSWRGLALVQASWLRALAKAPFSSSAVVLKYEDGRLFANTFSVAAKWIDVATPAINVPLNAPLSEILLLPRLYTIQQIVASGFRAKLLAAEQESIDRIRKAAKHLKALGVDEKTLAAWIEMRLNQEAANRLRSRPSDR